MTARWITAIMNPKPADGANERYKMYSELAKFFYETPDSWVINLTIPKNYPTETLENAIKEAFQQQRAEEELSSLCERFTK